MGKGQEGCYIHKYGTQHIGGLLYDLKQWHLGFTKMVDNWWSRTGRFEGVQHGWQSNVEESAGIVGQWHTGNGELA